MCLLRSASGSLYTVIDTLFDTLLPEYARLTHKGSGLFLFFFGFHYFVVLFVLWWFNQGVQYKTPEPTGLNFRLEDGSVLLDPKRNEHLLFHGTKPDIKDIVELQGFDPRVGGGMLGYARVECAHVCTCVSCAHRRCCGKPSSFRPQNRQTMMVVITACVQGLPSPSYDVVCDHSSHTHTHTHTHTDTHAHSNRILTSEAGSVVALSRGHGLVSRSNLGGSVVFGLFLSASSVVCAMTKIVEI